MLHHIDRLLAFWHLQAPSRDVPSQSCHSFRQLASCERRPRKYNFGSKSSIESSTQMTHEPNKLRFIYTICLPSFRSLLEAMNDSLMARMPAIGTFGGNHGRCPYLGAVHCCRYLVLAAHTPGQSSVLLPILEAAVWHKKVFVRASSCKG